MHIIQWTDNTFCIWIGFNGGGRPWWPPGTPDGGGGCAATFCCPGGGWPPFGGPFCCGGVWWYATDIWLIKGEYRVSGVNLPFSPFSPKIIPELERIILARLKNSALYFFHWEFSQRAQSSLWMKIVTLPVTRLGGSRSSLHDIGAFSGKLIDK